MFARRGNSDRFNTAAGWGHAKKAGTCWRPGREAGLGCLNSEKVIRQIPQNKEGPGQE